MNGSLMIVTDKGLVSTNEIFQGSDLLCLGPSAKWEWVRLELEDGQILTLHIQHDRYYLQFEDGKDHFASYALKDPLKITREMNFFRSRKGRSSQIRWRSVEPQWVPSARKALAGPKAGDPKNKPKVISATRRKINEMAITTTSDRYYYRGPSGKVCGPISAEKLADLYETEKLPWDALVKLEGDDEWRIWHTDPNAPAPSFFISLSGGEWFVVGVLAIALVVFPYSYWRDWQKELHSTNTESVQGSAVTTQLAAKERPTEVSPEEAGERFKKVKRHLEGKYFFVLDDGNRLFEEISSVALESGALRFRQVNRVEGRQSRELRATMDWTLPFRVLKDGNSRAVRQSDGTAKVYVSTGSSNRDFQYSGQAQTRTRAGQAFETRHSFGFESQLSFSFQDERSAKEFLDEWRAFVESL